jgi:hypothetical protein
MSAATRNRQARVAIMCPKTLLPEIHTIHAHPQRRVFAAGFCSWYGQDGADYKLASLDAGVCRRVAEKSAG